MQVTMEYMAGELRGLETDLERLDEQDRGILMQLVINESRYAKPLSTDGMVNALRELKVLGALMLLGMFDGRFALVPAKCYGPDSTLFVYPPPEENHA